ncbi:hypothetical protein NEOKW01_1408 [Nematocida sp. AWRm80]|nr:hypothetical protein NEOKW01_1408 [Nematocida sp. AWRm80]
MKKVLFGKRAVKKAPKRLENAYPTGAIVLGHLIREQKDSIEFKLPNGRIGVCYKEHIRQELEGIKTTKMIHTFDKYMLVELQILGERNNKQECTFFIYKEPNVQGLITGVIRSEEEIGYIVETGLQDKTFILQSPKQYRIGELLVLQVASLTGTTYTLTDTIDREIYIGSHKEIFPGLLLRSTITGRPPYISGENRFMATRLPYIHTTESLGLCNPLLETGQRHEIDDNVESIIVYVSEDRTVVHTVVYSEYTKKIESSCPTQKIVGNIFTGIVVQILDKKTFIRSENSKIKGILTPIHYSDMSNTTSLPPFSEGDKIQVRVFYVDGYNVYVTARESLIKAELPEVPLKPKTSVPGILTLVTDKTLCYTTFYNLSIVLIKEEEKEIKIGRQDTLRISKHKSGKLYFGRNILSMPPEKTTKRTRRIHDTNTPEDKENLQSQKPKKKKLTEEEKKEIYQKRKIKDCQKFTNGQLVEGKIQYIYEYGAYVPLTRNLSARIKIGEISSRFVQDWQSLVHVGQHVKIILYEIDYEKGTVEGSIKKYEIFNMVGETSAEETAPLVAEEPLAYGIDKEEESEEISSEEDETLQMEIFNSKNSAEPWIKRISNSTLKQIIKLYTKALDQIQSPDSKKQLILFTLYSLAAHPETSVPEEVYIPIVSEGIRREGSIFIKHSIDNVRNLPNLSLYEYLCAQYIKEKRDSPFGYKELIYAAQRKNTLQSLKDVCAKIKSSELKSTEKKDLELYFIDVLYRYSKEEGRSEIEKQISSSQNKHKLEWTLKYLDLEQESIQNTSDINYVRNLFEKTVNRSQLPVDGIKGIFKGYLKFEKEYGTKDQQEKVFELAKAYISQFD